MKTHTNATSPTVAVVIARIVPAHRSVLWCRQGEVAVPLGLESVRVREALRIVTHSPRVGDQSRSLGDPAGETKVSEVSSENESQGASQELLVDFVTRGVVRERLDHYRAPALDFLDAHLRKR